MLVVQLAVHDVPVMHGLHAFRHDGNALSGRHQSHGNLQLAHFRDGTRCDIAFAEHGQHLVGKAGAGRFRIHEQGFVDQVSQA
ncbi:hypothetical protein D3C72_2341800 [compost metagenome]